MGVFSVMDGTVTGSVFVGAHTFNQYQVIYVGPKGLLSITVGDCFCQC